MLESLRRHIMMQQQRGDIPDYVRDGLVVWFDAINRGGETGKWYDLINSDYFQIPDTLVGDDYVVLPNYEIPLSSTGRIIYPCTIEMCYTIEENLKSIYLLFCYKSIGYIDITSTGQITPASTLSYPYTSLFNGYNNLGKKKTVTLYGTRNPSPNNLQIYANKQRLISKVTSSIDQMFGRLVNASFGSASYGSVSQEVKIHSIRIYDRMITEEEAMHNQQVDNERFNLGL